MPEAPATASFAARVAFIHSLGRGTRAGAAVEGGFAGVTAQ
ncbi:hypothetical protein QF031_003039 [Pseudarthrobacter defluvii]|nr:hypothetical protein [Pseudarthrobacter defluvii]MDQ0770290.1 hypothetical protein [Pseudarthrobacter defluvii]